MVFFGFMSENLLLNAHSPEGEAFIVRGHHARHINFILAMGMTIDEAVDFAYNDREPYKGYHQDVFGTTATDAALAKEGQRQFYTDFLALPKHSTIRFVAGQKDGLCDTCILGKHCETTSESGDAHFLRVIGRIARESSMDDVLTEGEVNIEGWKKPSPILELPAWAARTVLSDLDFHAQTFPRLTRPLARALVKKHMKKHGTSSNQ